LPKDAGGKQETENGHYPTERQNFHALRHSHNPPRHAKIRAKPLHGTEYYSKRKPTEPRGACPGISRPPGQGSFCHLYGLPMDTAEDNEIMTANATISWANTTARRQAFVRGHCIELFQESSP
jgi:hypothetical protein